MRNERKNEVVRQDSRLHWVVIFTFAAVFAAGIAEAQLPAVCVRRGLVACWDGIANASDGTHNENATEWQDLVAGRSFALTGVTVEEKGMKFGGNWQTSYGELSAEDTDATFELAKDGTMELLMTPNRHNHNTSAFQSSYAAGMGFGLYNGDAILSAKRTPLIQGYDFSSTTNLVSVLYSDGVAQSGFVNGEKKTLSGSNTWGSYNDKTWLGRLPSGGNSFYGTIYALRIYSEKLKPEEIALNHALDRVRFDGVDAADAFAGLGVRLDSDGKFWGNVEITNTLGEAVLSLDGGTTWFAGTNGWFELYSELHVMVRSDVRQALQFTGAPVTMQADGTAVVTVTGRMSLTAAPQEGGTRRWNSSYSGYEYLVTISNTTGEAVLLPSEGGSPTAVLRKWVAEGEGMGFDTVRQIQGLRLAFLDFPPNLAISPEGISGAVRNVTEGVTVRVFSFVPTHVWTGGKDTAFDNPANWWDTAADNVAEKQPEETATAFVPDGATRQPTASSSLTVKNLYIGSLTNGPGTATLTFSHNKENEVLSDCRVFTKGKITHKGLSGTTYTMAESYRVALKVSGSMTVDVGGSVSAYDCGYARAGNSNIRHAGAYTVGTAYGSLSCPTNSGIGGSDHAGGGTIKIEVDGDLTVDGDITSCSGNYADNQGTGKSGAGGSIWLIVRRLKGAGSLLANAGNCQNTPGSGGRIAVHLTEATDFSDWKGKMQAYGGRSNTKPGPAGTIYLQAAGQDLTTATVLVDNGDTKSASASTEFSEACGATTVGTLVLTNGAIARVMSGSELNVYGDLQSHGATLSNVGDATVRFAGSAPATVACDASCVFPNVVCEVPGKTISFGTGPNDVFTVSDNGSFVMKGGEGQPLALVGVGGGTWKLDLGDGVTMNLWDLAVTNSDASAGICATAYRSVGADNENWSIFGGSEVFGAIAWTGETSSDWSDARNWDPMRVPCAYDQVTVPGGCSNNPQIVSTGGAVVSLDTLTVANGATLTLDGANLSVTSAVTCCGTVVCKYRETITAFGAVDFSQGSFVCGESTLLLTGDAAQAANLGTSEFGTVRIRKDTGSVTFAAGFTTRGLVIESDGALNVLFAEGQTATCDELTLHGTAFQEGSPCLALGSAGSGVWKLAVRAAASVSGVLVSKSDATSGLDIFADLTSKDGGGNDGWHFGSLVQAWTGRTSAAFDVAGNWEPAIVPGPTSRVTIASATTVTLSNPITVENVVLGDGAVAATLKVNARLDVKDSLDVRGKATLVANKPIAVTNLFAVRAGATVKHDGVSSTDYKASTEVNKIDVFAGAAFILEDGGTVTANESGYSGGNATSAPHAGTRVGGDTHGSLICPTRYGRPGTDGYSGGAIKIATAGDLTVNGTISANARSYSYNNGQDYYVKAGAGGSIWLIGKRLKGAGTMEANAGDCHGNNGSGGRIAVHLAEATDLTGWTGKIHAYGARSNTAAGPVGSVYLQFAGQTAETATAIFDNGGKDVGASPATGYAELNALCESDRIGTLIVTNWARVKITAGTELRISRALLTKGGYLSADPDAAVRFVGTEPATVACDANCAIPNVVCEVPGKTISFGTGPNDVFTVSDDGSFVMKGGEGQPLALVGVGGGTWRMDLGGGVSMDLWDLAVTNSDASAGICATAYRSVGADNENWSIFGGSEVFGAIRWTGETSSDWNDARNWDPMRVPCAYDQVTIPGSRPNNPQIVSTGGAVVSLDTLTVANGATLTLDGANLSVTGAVTCCGTVVCTYRETVTAFGSVDFSQGSFVRGESTLLLAGDAAQTANLGTSDFYLVRIRKDAGSVTFTAGFTTKDFAVESDGALNVLFAEGQTATCDELTLCGTAFRDGEPCLMLDSAGSGAWKLAVRASASVAGTLVCQSDAKSGLDVFADLTSKDGGGNSGWHFGSLVQAWTGRTSAAFDVAGNWEPAIVPGPTSRVTIASATAVTLSNPITVENLVLGDGAVAASLKVNARLDVKDSLDVRGAATLVANKPIVVTNLFAVRAGATVKHDGVSSTDYKASTEVNKIDVFAGAAFILEDGGTVTANESGYARSSNSNIRHAGAYTEGTAYGSLSCPTNYGMGGGDHPGGGSIKIKVDGELTVNGDITASSGNYAPNYGIAKAGAGGSIWLIGKRLKGGGTMKANAGDCQGSPGSGGRIAVHLTEATDFSDWTGKMQAYGGGSNTNPGPAGTIYLQAAGQDLTTATVIVDNGGTKKAAAPTEFSEACGATTVGTLVLANGAIARIMSGSVMTVYGDWLGAGGYTTKSGTLVLAPDDGKATVTGPLELDGLVCTNGAEEIVFGAGGSVTVADNGTLWLEGRSERKLVLKSSVDGSFWNISVGTNLTGKVRYLDVRDSDASGGQLIKAKQSVGKKANNVNWEFPSGMALIVK